MLMEATVLISRFQLVERPFQDGARAARVQAHEAFPFLAEDGSVIQGQARSVHKEFRQFLLRQVQFPAVQENQVGGVRKHGLDFRHAAAQFPVNVADVFLDVVHRLLEPFLPFRAGVGADEPFVGKDWPSASSLPLTKLWYFPKRAGFWQIR